ncbi:MAG: tetratricopeptide repeat protein [Planctomycetota bacterium]
MWRSGKVMFMDATRARRSPPRTRLLGTRLLLAVGLMLVAPAVLPYPEPAGRVLAQEQPDTERRDDSGNPLLPESKATDTTLDTVRANGMWFWRQWYGKVVVILVGVSVFLRVFYAVRSNAQQAAARGGGGLMGDYFAQKQLETLLQGAKFEDAAEHVLRMGAGGKGQSSDPNREIEAAELFLKARRFGRAAEIFVKKGRLKRAAEAYERAQSFDLAAELYEKAQDYERAEHMYLQAKNKPAVARMWSTAGNHQKAAAYFTEIARPKEAGEHLEKLGKKVEACEKYVEALSLLTTGASRDKQLRAGERDIGVEAESKELFAKICKLYDEAKDWDRYAAFLMKQGRPDAAAEVYRKAGDLPRAAELMREARSWDAAGRLMQELGKQKEALVLFAQARQERNELDKAAELYLEAGEFRIAAENYEKLGKIAAAAEIYEKHRDPQRAADLYAKISDYKKAAILYEQTKQWNAAVFCYEQLDQFPKVAECWEKAGNFFLAGVTWFTQRETQKAIAALRKVPKESEDRREGARLLGILLHEANKDSEAMPFFEEGFGRKIEKDDVEAFYYYAQTLEHMPPERPKAINAYETIQKLRPNYRDTARRLDALRGGKPLPKTSVYSDGADDPGSLFHTSRFSLRGEKRS